MTSQSLIWVWGTYAIPHNCNNNADIFEFLVEPNVIKIFGFQLLLLLLF